MAWLFALLAADEPRDRRHHRRRLRPKRMARHRRPCRGGRSSTSFPRICPRRSRPIKSWSVSANAVQTCMARRSRSIALASCRHWRRRALALDFGQVGLRLRLSEIGRSGQQPTRASRHSASEPKRCGSTRSSARAIATESQRPLGSLPLVDTNRTSGCLT